MEIKTDVNQVMTFEKKETPHLSDVKVMFYNGHFQSVCFRVVEGNYYELRHAFDSIKEIHFILGKIIEMQEGNNKAHTEETIVKGRTRLIRLDDND
jgi:hypothetical protein